jgi:two-component system response regulator FlrC
MTARIILVVEDDNALREALADTVRFAGYAVRTAADGREALEVLDRENIDLVVSDVRMQPMDGHALLQQIRARRPGLPVLLMTAFGTIQQAVEALHQGASDYLVKPFEAEALLARIGRYLPGAADADPVAEDGRMRAVMELARRVAQSDATVMITGESGTGKEVIARYIHRHSRRADGPFVAINCAAIPDTMLEATLFGYEKGAFTGAYHASAGKFEQAQGGTLLLDEITEMGLGLQAKLLRVLQEKEVERLGGRKPIALDVRVLATSNRVLAEEVAARRFREDLFYRLNVFPVHLPALRERPADILPLARHLLARHARALGRPLPELTAAAAQRLHAHRWSGNVRELDNVMQRAVILAGADKVDAAHLTFEQAQVSRAPGPHAALAPQSAGCFSEDLKSHERQLILEALKAAGGSRKRAAARLGISARTLRYKLARLRAAGIEVPAYSLADCSS